MTRYLIKHHYEATENNPNFKGSVQDWYEGKGGRLLSRDRLPFKYEIIEDGYLTKSAATRRLMKAKEEDEAETADGYWNVTCSIETIEV